MSDKLSETPLSERMRHFDAKYDNHDPGWFADEVAALEAQVAAMREATQPLLDAYLRARGEPGLVYIAPYMSALELTLRQAAAKDGST